MSSNQVTPSDFFNPNTQVANIALISCPGAEALTEQINDLLALLAAFRSGAIVEQHKG